MRLMEKGLPFGILGAMPRSEPCGLAGVWRNHVVARAAGESLFGSGSQLRFSLAPP
jgi:hypothetical protein